MNTFFSNIRKYVLIFKKRSRNGSRFWIIALFAGLGQEKVHLTEAGKSRGAGRV